MPFSDKASSTTSARRRQDGAGLLKDQTARWVSRIQSRRGLLAPRSYATPAATPHRNADSTDDDEGGGGGKGIRRASSPGPSARRDIKIIVQSTAAIYSCDLLICLRAELDPRNLWHFSLSHFSIPQHI